MRLALILNNAFHLTNVITDIDSILINVRLIQATKNIDIIMSVTLNEYITPGYTSLNPINPFFNRFKTNQPQKNLYETTTYYTLSL